MPVGFFGAGADWFVPSQLIFARSHRDWDLIPADLPQHATYREGGCDCCEPWTAEELTSVLRDLDAVTSLQAQEPLAG